MSFLPWLCFDFNEILNLNETMGGNEKNSSRVHEFRQVVRDCGLTDLGLNGTHLLSQIEDLAPI